MFSKIIFKSKKIFKCLALGDGLSQLWPMCALETMQSLKVRWDSVFIKVKEQIIKTV